jgi:hypothetical protein
MKQNLNYIYFSYKDFNKENFFKEIRKNFHLNTNYSILIKISSESNTIFKMAGTQIGLFTGEEHSQDYYFELFEVLKERIDIIFDTYEYIDIIETILIIYSEVSPSEEYKLKNVNNYLFNTRLVSNKNVKKNFNQNILPLTLNPNKLGIKVIEEEKLEILNSILETNNYLNLNINEIIKQDDIRFYTNPKNQKRIIISNKKETGGISRYIFDFKTRLLIKEIFDFENFPFYFRKIGNLTLKFDNNKVYSYAISNKLVPIKPIKKPILERNVRIGTFDLETFTDIDGFSKIFALGFKTKKDKEPILFFIDNNLNSESLVENCINSMLTNYYNNYVFYVHNFSRYDVVFLYNILLKINDKKGYSYYNLKTTMRDDDIIRLDISIKDKNLNSKISKSFKISFRDSMAFLNKGLDHISKEFNIKYKKGLFPHNFVNRQTINYKGKKPDISYYINSKKTFTIEDRDFYSSIPLDNWDLKKECLNYLKLDILALLEVIEEFNRLIYIYFNQQISESLTITRLALNIYYKSYYNIQERPIPYINKPYLFNFIKEGYFGGITEVYRPYGENLVYIDINSLYPYSALKEMPGLNCEWVEAFDQKDPLDLDKLFGFFQARIETNNNYIGLLPIRLNNKIIFPNGKFEGIWSSEELLFARNQGYKVTVIKGYNFDKIKDTFKPFILDLYDKKKNSKGFIRNIYKSLLNNFLGRFGLNFIKPITQLVNKEKRDLIISTREVFSHKELSNNKFIIKYSPIINKVICESHGLDFYKVLGNDYKSNLDNKLDAFKDVSLAITAMVNAYARTYMHKFKLEILKKGGQIYYSDTDSLVLNKEFLNKEWLGEEIGKFKLVYEIKRGYFISNKTYCLILNDDSVVIKSKGVSNNSLTEKDFIDMYVKDEKVKAYKYISSKFYDKATVIIEKKDVLLNQTSFDKREKLLDNEGLWIDTKPIHYEN